MSDRAYEVEVFWSDEDEGYIARLVSMHSVSAFGKTEDDALAEMQIVLSMLREIEDDQHERR